MNWCKAWTEPSLVKCQIKVPCSPEREKNRGTLAMSYRKEIDVCERQILSFRQVMLGPCAMSIVVAHSLNKYSTQNVTLTAGDSFKT